MSQIQFTLRASPVLAEHRSMYKISLILLILFISSRGAKASLPKLQLFNWALKNKDRQNILIKAAQNQNLDISAWGFDPVLTVALNYAIADNLIQITSTGYQLTEFGEIFAKQICDNPNILMAEKSALKQIGKSILESMVDTVTKSWLGT